MAVNDVQSSCDFLLYSVRNSGLNFTSQETPFSIFLTLRKSFVKSFQPQIKSEENKLFVKNLKAENLEEVNKKLEEALKNLKMITKMQLLIVRLKLKPLKSLTKKKCSKNSTCQN